MGADGRAVALHRDDAMKVAGLHAREHVPVVAQRKEGGREAHSGQERRHGAGLQIQEVRALAARVLLSGKPPPDEDVLSVPEEAREEVG